MRSAMPKPILTYEVLCVGFSVVSHSIQLSYQRIRSVRNKMYFITRKGFCQQFFEIFLIF